MAKYYGRIGFGVEVEISPGVWDYAIVEKSYYGDVVRDTLESVSGDTVLGDRKTANAFRIVADPYAENNFFDMKYLEWNGRKWNVRQVEIQSRPRMLIRIGGVYEGPAASTGEVGDPAG